MKVSLVIDVSSVELFADDGLSIMTSIFFPNKPYDQIELQSKDRVGFSKIEYIKLNKTGK
jgi:fructan beta-fructosidase